MTDQYYVESCVFCRIIRGKEDATFIYRNNVVSAFLDIHPLFEGHVLIVPNKHFSDITDVDKESLDGTIEAAKIVSEMLMKNLDADGINIVHSTGKSAGQTIYHFHLHVLPRREEDDAQFQRWWFSRSHKASREELNALVSRILK
ncbi:MAG: HIT domain-containing protein [Thermoplasmatales archaeon]